MLEVEAKFALGNAAELEKRLLALGAVPVADQIEVDHYLNAPDRDFSQTDEALRLRCIGEQNFLTYKGPRREASSKTRTEAEISCPPGSKAAEEFLTLFRHLGYRSTAMVRKRRKLLEWHRDGFTLHACLDDVEGVGRFIELEIVAEETDYEAARATVFRTAEELKLGATETRSYLEQLLGHTVVPGGKR